MEKIKKIAEKSSELLIKYNTVCLLVIFAVFLFSRLFRLDMIPAGIHYDEAGMAFDAKSLAMYGTDRHNNRLPFYLPAYGGGQSALYAYMLAILLKVLPFSVYVMRIPAVILGAVAFFASYLLVREIYNDKRWALLGPILVTITPYFFYSERWALDCNLFLSVMTLSFYWFYRANKRCAVNTEAGEALVNDTYKSWIKNNYVEFAIAGLTLGLTLYTYVLSYIVLPIFLILVVIYLISIKKFDIKKYIALAVPMGILALPLLLMQLINMGKLQPFSFLIWDFPKLGFYRGGEMSIAAIPRNLYKMWLMLFIGTQSTFNAVPHFGPVYVVSIPLIIGGFVITIVNVVKAIRRREMSVDAFILALFIAGNLMVMMIAGGLNIYTGNELFLVYILFIIASIKWIHERFVVITPVILLGFAVCFLLFSNYYFRHYNEECGVQVMFVSNEYPDVVKFVNDTYNPEHKKVYFDMAPQHCMYPDVIVGMSLGANPATWESDFDEKNMVDNIYCGFPEGEIDMNEDCIWIFSKEAHGHIPPYFVAEGWNYDDHFDSYVILYR